MSKRKKKRIYNNRDYSNVKMYRAYSDRNITTEPIQEPRSLINTIGLFIRNKIIELIGICAYIIFGSVVVGALFGLVLGVIGGFGWVMCHFHVLGTKPVTQLVDYVTIGVIPLLGFMVIGILCYVIVMTVIGISKWIKSNWEKAQKGVRVKLFEN